MNISGIRPLTGLSAYNMIRTAAVHPEDVAAAAREKTENSSPKAKEQQSYERPEQKFGSFDFAKMYRPNENPQMKGQDSDIKSLDMEKAISDMRKDQVLQQYQFFVGEKVKTGAISENFDL